MRKKYTTFLEEDLIKKLKITAVEEDTHANFILENLLKDYFKKKEGDKN